MRKFERFISLGNYCLTRFQIDRHLCNKYLNIIEDVPAKAASLAKELGIRFNGGNHLFDWVVIHDYRKLIALFERNQLREDLAAMNFKVINDGNSIADNDVGIWWHQLFDRRNDKKLYPEDIQEQLQEKRQKQAYLAGKFMDLSYYRTLYVMNAKMSESRLLELREALATIRRGDERFHILQCSEDAPVEFQRIHRNISLARVTKPIAYMGDRDSWASWDAALSRFEFIED